MDIDALASFITLDKHAQRELSKLIPLFKLSDISFDISVYDNSLTNFNCNIVSPYICDFTLYTNPEYRIQSDNESIFYLKNDFKEYGNYAIPNESWYDDSISNDHYNKQQYHKRIQAWNFLKYNINEKNYIWKEAKKTALNINLNIDL